MSTLQTSRITKVFWMHLNHCLKLIYSDLRDISFINNDFRKSNKQCSSSFYFVSILTLRFVGYSFYQMYKSQRNCYL